MKSDYGIGSPTADSEFNQSKPIPLFIRGLGRSGTTILMNLLSSSSKVLCPEGNLFENRYISALHAVSSMFLVPDMLVFLRSGLINSGEFERTHLFRLHFEIDEQVIDPDEFYHDAFISLYKAFLKHINKRFGNKIKYYAEKSMGPRFIPFYNELGARVIHVIRDPRDHIVSTRKFNEKRGFLDFGWQKGDTTFIYARRLIAMYRSQLNWIVESEAKPETEYCIRYEDMIGNLDEQSESLSEWLGVDLHPEQIRNTQGAYEDHMTSSSPQDSVQRWRTELDAETLSFLEEKLGKQLLKAGYELSK